MRNRASFLLLGMVLASCTGKKNPDDPDSYKEKAVAVSIGESATDSLKKTQKETDEDDWKYVELTEPGKLRIAITFGNPKCFCSVELYDPNGKKLATHKDVGNLPRTDLIVDKAQPGKYLLHFSARYEGDFSSYLVEPLFRSSVKPKEPEEPEEPPIEVEPQKLSAAITQSKPGKAGVMVITLDKGSKDGMKEGLLGSVEGLENGEIKIIKVEETTSQGEVNATAKTIKGKTTATFQLTP